MIVFSCKENAVINKEKKKRDEQQFSIRETIIVIDEEE